MSRSCSAGSGGVCVQRDLRPCARDPRSGQRPGRGTPGCGHAHPRLDGEGARAPAAPPDRGSFPLPARLGDVSRARALAGGRHRVCEPLRFLVSTGPIPRGAGLPRAGGRDPSAFRQQDRSVLRPQRADIRPDDARPLGRGTCAVRRDPRRPDRHEQCLEPVHRDSRDLPAPRRRRPRRCSPAAVRIPTERHGRSEHGLLSRCGGCARFCARAPTGSSPARPGHDRRHRRSRSRDAGREAGASPCPRSCVRARRAGDGRTAAGARRDRGSRAAAPVPELRSRSGSERGLRASCPLRTATSPARWHSSARSSSRSTRRSPRSSTPNGSRGSAAPPRPSRCSRRPGRSSSGSAPCPGSSARPRPSSCTA